MEAENDVILPASPESKRILNELEVLWKKSKSTVGSDMLQKTGDKEVHP